MFLYTLVESATTLNTRPVFPKYDIKQISRKVSEVIGLEGVEAFRKCECKWYIKEKNCIDSFLQNEKKSCALEINCGFTISLAC